MWCNWLIVITMYLAIGVFLAELFDPRSSESATFILIFWPFVLTMLVFCWAVFVAPVKFSEKIKKWIEKKGIVEND